MIERRKTKKMFLGSVAVGGDSPITVQSMTNERTSDIEATVRQIRELECAGCDIVRVAVPDDASAIAIGEIKKQTSLPVVADIHFDWRLAILSMENGVEGIRVNPGTIKSRKGLMRIAKVAVEREVVVRVGVNAGSPERRLEEGSVEARSLARSAIEGALFFESEGVEKIKISVKASDVPRTMEAYRIVARETEFPLHVGITEAGPFFSGAIRNSVGIGALLAEGIGDTIRVSLSAPPVEEVRVGRQILTALELIGPVPRVVSCPTCARSEIDVIGIASEVERRLENFKGDMRVAVMGCAVNGPGEAREADFGIVGGRGKALLYAGGKLVARVPESRALDALLEELEKCKKGNGCR
ncbi:MAG: flavodoxin-dependent (E)-4-hydroxy-3-methylbut-2-enyl-diphosphate synthase [Actinomycetota bacterium]|nr:flavodoxin-dependent (E)-4-hydroxy-3-methylbut-2-enyl-diphosphate synthase [Actinomycetota bacterium]